MQTGNELKNEKRPFYKRLTFRFYCIAAISLAALLVFPLWILQKSMDTAVMYLMYEQLDVDLNFLTDEFSDHTEQSAEWKRRDGALYIGDKLIGDGTEEHADTEMFLHCGDITGSDYYSFVKTDNDGELAPGEGHYLRVAGSTRGKDGERIEGTYIEKEIADQLESDTSLGGKCFIVANVAGRRIRTLYRLIYDRDGNIAGILAAGRDEQELHDFLHTREQTAFFLIIAVVLIIFVGIGIFLRGLLQKLGAMKQQLDLIGHGTFPDRKLSLRGDDELNDVADSINEMTVSLREKERMGTELLVAADIQQRLLPSAEERRFPEGIVDIAASMKPAKEIAGDFYDYFMIDDRHLAFIVADVSGEGLPASLFMVRTKTLIKSYAQMGFAPAEIMEKTNSALCESNTDDYFVTAWLGMLDLETGELCYVNAGHNPPMLDCGNSGYQPLVSRPNFVLASFDRIVYEEKHITMAPGDSILLYTDGVTEAMNRDEKFFGTGNLLDCINSFKDRSSGTIIEKLDARLHEFIGQEEQNDDVTMLHLRYLRKLQQPPKRNIREFDAAEKKLPEILEYAENELRQTDFPEKNIIGLLGVVEELYLNIAKYAYGGASGVMSLEILTDNADEVRMIFTDYGIPFNPILFPDPDTTAETEKRKVGGLGIYMVKSFADNLSYRYEDGKNVLTVTKMKTE